MACFGDDRVVRLSPGGESRAQRSSSATEPDLSGIADLAGRHRACSSTLESARRVGGRSAPRRSTGSSADSVPVGPLPRALAVSGDGATIWIGRLLSDTNHAELRRVDAGSLAVTDTERVRKFGGETHRDSTAAGRGVPNYLTSLALSHDGGDVWAAANKPNFERGSFFNDPLDTDNTVRNLALRVSSGDGAVFGLDIDNSDSASAVALSPFGDYLFVALQGNDEVLVVDALSAGNGGGFGVVTRVDVGAAPRGVCFDTATQRTFVKNFMGRSVTMLETAALFEQGSQADRLDDGVDGDERGAPARRRARQASVLPRE